MLDQDRPNKAGKTTVVASMFLRRCCKHKQKEQLPAEPCSVAPPAGRSVVLSTQMHKQNKTLVLLLLLIKGVVVRS